MENIFKNVVIWGGIAGIFSWLQFARFLDFGANPNLVLLGLILAWATGRFSPPLIFGILAALAYLSFAPFDIWPLASFLIAGSAAGLASRFLTGKKILDEILAAAGGVFIFNLLVGSSAPVWPVWILEVAATEAILILSWPLFQKIK